MVLVLAGAEVAGVGSVYRVGGHVTLQVTPPLPHVVTLITRQAAVLQQYEMYQHK